MKRELAFAERLLSVTEGCRPDMHEPDEQAIVARVVGSHLDNACGEAIQERAIVGGFQEYVVVLERFRADVGFQVERFNLASLIALAREGAQLRVNQAKRHIWGGA